MPRMDLPKAFTVFSRGFHQDMDIISSSLNEVIDVSLEALDREHKAILKTFLRKSLSERDSVLEEIWNASQADMFIWTPSQIRSLFIEVMRRL